MSEDDWVDASKNVPCMGEIVLTYGPYGYVVAHICLDLKWQAEHVDFETGEPWLAGDGGEPTHWMKLEKPKTENQ